MSIEIKNVSKKYENYQALKDINLNIETGRLVALLGPSGCGKTTLLRIIAGLEIPDSGSVILHGENATERKAKDRKVGFVFQHYALFNHLNIFENVAFGLKVLPYKQRPSKKVINEKVMKLLHLVQMEWAVRQYPFQLSGGQRQRIALARALAVEPKLLMLDEPFSALDAKVRLELRRWIRKLHDEIHITSLFVTHDQEEALELADEVVIINEGKIEQTGTPEEVYENPRNAFVYNFLGNVNVFHCRVNKGRASLGSLQFNLMDVKHDMDMDSCGQLFVRPHEVDISLSKRDEQDIAAEITDIRNLGAIIGLELKSKELESIIEAEINRDFYRVNSLKKGDVVFIKLKNVRFFSKDNYSI